MRRRKKKKKKKRKKERRKRKKNKSFHDFFTRRQLGKSPLIPIKKKLKKQRRRRLQPISVVIIVMVVPVSRPTQQIAGIEQNDPYSELFLSQKRKRFLTSFDVVVVSLVTSIFLYACESWTLTAELQRRIQAVEMRCYRKILHISYKDHVTNEEVRAKIQQAIGPHEDLLTIVKRRKLQQHGHISHSSGLVKSCLARWFTI